MSRAPDRRMFYTIDGLRGIAALLVVCRHIVPLHAGRLNFPSSYLAVELFFLFSGFVIAHAYDKRFDAGMGFWDFFKARLIRLYPLYFLGFAIAVLTVPLTRHMGFRTWPLDPRLIVPNLLMLPTYLVFAGGAMFPFNGPSWTLFFELLANFLYCLIYRGLTAGRLALFVVVMGALLAFSSFYFGALDIGYMGSSFVGGLARVGFSFFAGVGVYRFQLWRPCPIRISPWLLLAGATALLVQSVPRGIDRELYDAICAVVVFPLFAYLATAVEPGRIGQNLFTLGGGASYALYLIHAPLGGALIVLLAHHGRLKGSILLGLTFIAVVSVLAVLAERFYDRPVRRWITGLTSKRPREADRNPVSVSNVPSERKA
jgi:peptidoglycan/LPS O-acetylase OafA/YrhL